LQLNLSPKRTQEKLGVSLQKLAIEDPEASACASMKRPIRPLLPEWVNSTWKSSWTAFYASFKVEANVGKPQVAYRETITKKVEQEGKYIKQTGGRGQYGSTFGSRSSLSRLVRASNSPTISLAERYPRREFIPAVEKGVKEAMDNGIQAGCRVRGYQDWYFRRLLPRRRFEREIAFKIAASMAFKDGLPQGRPHHPRTRYGGRSGST
jgi:elongation factor G